VSSRDESYPSPTVQPNPPCSAQRPSAPLDCPNSCGPDLSGPVLSRSSSTTHADPTRVGSGLTSPFRLPHLYLNNSSHAGSTTLVRTDPSHVITPTGLLFTRRPYLVRPNRLLLSQPHLANPGRPCPYRRRPSSRHGHRTFRSRRAVSDIPLPARLSLSKPYPTSQPFLTAHNTSIPPNRLHTFVPSFLCPFPTSTNPTSTKSIPVNSHLSSSQRLFHPAPPEPRRTYPARLDRSTPAPTSHHRPQSTPPAPCPTALVMSSYLGPVLLPYRQVYSGPYQVWPVPLTPASTSLVTHYQIVPLRRASCRPRLASTTRSRPTD